MQWQTLPQQIGKGMTNQGRESYTPYADKIQEEQKQNGRSDNKGQKLNVKK